MLHTESHNISVTPVIDPRNPDKDAETFPKVNLPVQELPEKRWLPGRHLRAYDFKTPVLSSELRGLGPSFLNLS